ncbi:flagellar basal body-associated FliL family protein [Peredibacter starrii]|uniref:Flagellar protein FliL n=1 Tax=Peredibacter starrii TaxID=28202 RepID=A0AAX4HSP4_9BACT|nr:flagellar basal body-associated FliL family protein [Peredibacter starrii]WPU66215.1 flagellar basal body-associated FliL family protein [Peredibacter starrii]
MVQKILIILNLVIVVAGAGLVFYSHNMIKPEPTNQAAEAEKMKTDALESSQIQPVPIKKFVVNLHSRSTRLRYLDLEMNVLPFHEDQKELIKANEHIFKDILIEIASHLEPDELDSVTGKILLENKIKKAVNAKLGQPVVKQIYFSGFVVQ